MTDPAAIDTPGLRERKRVATKRAIEIAAITLVRDQGLDAVTVDEIARVADVSPRTFFNYFSSKEEAIVGNTPEMPSEEAQEEFVLDPSPVFAALARLFSRSIATALQDQEVLMLRRTLMKSDPELGGRRWASIHRFETKMVELIARRIATQNPELAHDEDVLRTRARLIAMMAVAGMRHAWLTWMDDNGEHGTLHSRLMESFGAMPEIVRSSV
ncbi:MAG TPA: TetR/AcrR family transcriptional regulator [Pseudolysinimonas sp.]|nr:TetR/AcrR family transcriptional regulator [Pseudolysinimonas sp.]